MDDKLIELIELIQSLAPRIWELAMREVYVNIAEVVAFGLFTALLTIYYFRKFESWSDAWEDDDKASAIFLLVLVGFALLIMIPIALVELFGLPSEIFNPEFEAIRLLIGQFAGSS